MTATLGLRSFLVAAEELQWLVGSARDLDDCVVFDAAVLILESLLEEVDDQVGMRVVCTEDKGLLERRRIELLGQEATHNPIEGLCDHFAVEALYLDLDLVRSSEKLDLAALRLVDGDFLSSLPDNAALRELCRDLHRGLMVDQVAIDHGLPIAVGVDGRAKDLSCVECGGGGEADLVGVEVVEDPTVLRDVVCPVAAEA